MTELLQTSVASDGTVYRDLNGNGIMDPYEDPRLSITRRVNDLLSRMTVAEKVGELFQIQLEVGPDGTLVESDAIFCPEGTTGAIRERHVTHFCAILLGSKSAAEIARWHNRLQKVAEASRLGIPITLSTDPLHSDVHNAATAVRANAVSAWPEALGLAALGETEVREFADVARREYTAVGLRSALHPQIDLATEPRWARQSGTFGADAVLSGECARAYIAGFQGTSARRQPLTSTSVACMAKHFPGGGPQRDGEDPHFPYGREQVYPGGMFDYHLRPFIDAIEAGVAAIMPYYGMPVGLERGGRPVEAVGFAFNKAVITGILRDELGFDGVVCTDFGIIKPYIRSGFVVSPARAWGVEHLDPGQRIAKALDAGCDQFGGEICTEVLLALVADGTVSEERLDESVARLLRVKFELGLFDNPYVDEGAASERVANESAVAAGFRAQVASLVCIEDKGQLLPIPAATRVCVEGADPSAFAEVVQVVGRPEDADLVVLRLPAPYEPRSEYILEPQFHAGSLEFSTDVIDRVRTLATIAPVIVETRLERPSILTPFIDLAAVVIGSFGATDRAVAHGLTEAGAMRGRLPFDLPASMASVGRSRPDVPDDLDEVLYSRGHGMT